MLNETYSLHLVMHDPDLLIKELYGIPSGCPTFQKKLEIILQSSSWFSQTDEQGYFCLNRKSNML